MGGCWRLVFFNATLGCHVHPDGRCRPVRTNGPPPSGEVRVPLYGRHRLFSELARDTHTHILMPLVLVCPSECSFVCSSFRSSCVRRPSALSPLFYSFNAIKMHAPLRACSVCGGCVMCTSIRITPCLYLDTVYLGSFKIPGDRRLDLWLRYVYLYSYYSLPLS